MLGDRRESTNLNKLSHKINENLDSKGNEFMENKLSLILKLSHFMSFILEQTLNKFVWYISGK